MTMTFNTVGGFSNADKTVVNWEGRNYYQACDAPVVVNADGSGTHCVKREGHPGDIHEDYDGVRQTEAKGRMAIVVTYTLHDDMETGFKETQQLLQELKPLFRDKPDVKIYGAVSEMADQLIMILEGDG